MNKINKLKAFLELDEEGEEIAENLINILVNDLKRAIFITQLSELKGNLITLNQEIKLTQIEQDIKDLVLVEGIPISAEDVSRRLGDKHSSLKHRTHASKSLNILASHGILGKFKMGRTYYFTSPKEAVRQQVKIRGESLDNCSPSKIAQESGMPLSVVIEMLNEMNIE